MQKIKWLVVALFAILSANTYAQTELQKAIAATEAEKFNEAKQILNKLILAEPANPEYYYYQGMNSYQEEEYEQARGFFQKGIKAKTKYALNHVGLGRVLLREGKKEDAKIEFEKAVEHNKTGDVNIILAMGYAYLDGGRSAWTDAEKAFTLAETKAPKDPKVRVALGDLYMKQKVSNLAIAKYTSATELDPKFAEGFYKLGLLKLDEGNEYFKKDKREKGIEAYTAARDYLNKATETNPNFAPAYRERGEAFFRAGNYEKARDEYKRYVELAQNDLRARTRYASFLYLSENYKEAIEVIEKTLKDTTTNVMLRLAGYSHFKTGNPTKGKEFMDQYFARINPEYTLSEDFDNFARIQYALNKPEAEVMKSVETCLKKDSSRFDVMNMFVDSTMAKKARATNPEDKKKLSLVEAKYRQALIDTKAKAVKDPSATDYLRMAFAYYGAADWDNAEKTFKRITEFSPDYSPPYYWLGVLATKKESGTDKTGGAIPYYQKVIDLLETKKDRVQTETDYLLTAYSYFAYAEGKIKGVGTPNGFSCEAAKPFIQKGLAIKADDANLKELSESCP